jgi:hypothetical protein
MRTGLDPFSFLVNCIAGWMNQHQHDGGWGKAHLWDRPSITVIGPAYICSPKTCSKSLNNSSADQEITVRFGGFISGCNDTRDQLPDA